MKSFTLIEIVVAIFIITTGTLGAFTLIQRTIAFIPIASSRLTAAYLAQEGIEIVRNTRDTNWLSGNFWNEGLASGGWEVVNMHGEPTKFRRKLTISEPGPDEMVILVEVSWEERGRTHQVNAQTELDNWR